MQRTNQDELKRKLERIEALYRRPGSDGEKQAAAIAANKIREKLRVVSVYSKPVIKEYQFEVFLEA